MEMEIEDEIFDKVPKKKKQLSEKQLAALAKGREKVKEKRMAKMKEAAEVKASKEAKAVEKSKAKMTRMEQARSKVQTTARRKKIEKFNDHKYRILEEYDDENDFNDFARALDSVDEDLMASPKKLKKYLGDMITANGGKVDY